MAAEVKVVGAAELRRNLRRADKGLPKGMTAIHRTVAEPVAEDARPRARRRSGRLAGSIRARATSAMARVEAGRGLEYAGVQHWGWPAHDIEPNPFLVEAIAAKESASVELYERELSIWLDSIWQDS